ncbi:hypothetical protein AAC387_Pa05g0575 [Persea americana]
MAPPPAKQTPPAPDPNPKKQFGNRKETDEDEAAPPSHNLWVGNLSPETTDSDVMSVFARHGALDSVTTYSSRNYAFVYFSNPEDARKAKVALQGHIICGSAIKIEFARPAKAGKHLWVGAISSSVTKEQLEGEFSKFGKIEEFKFLRDRNSALVDYNKLEDAVAALKNMNGKRLGGEQIRVDFLRSQPSRRDNWSDFHDVRDGRFSNRKGAGPPDLWMPPDFPESSQFGSRRQPSSQNFGGRRGDSQPSNVLWIGYPPSVYIQEQMLHNAMILFGEIERIKSFPNRHYSFVEFRSVDEARRAKEGLQGRLFNDPRIQIMFSSSDFAPGKDSPTFYPGIRGPRPDMFFNEPPFRPGPMDLFSHTRPLPPNNFPGPLGPNAMPGPNLFMRPFGPRGFDPLIAGPEFNDLPGFLHNFADANRENPMGANWRRQSPSASGMLPSPVQGMRPPPRPIPGMWDGFDASPLQRESKRSRMDGPLQVDGASFHGRKMDNQGTGDTFGFGSQLDRGAVSIHGHVHGHIQQGPVVVRAPSTDRLSHAEHQAFPDNDHCWRGIIAKGGTPVCHARCIPIGKGIGSQIPEIVNCSARTGLDMLTKHYAEASGFEIVFFLPDSEEDFASYTEFLRYLGMKNRAGVAKFDDGTTLFLVPPSDFLTKVLNVSGPERLYGVVLKMPQQPPTIATQQSQLPVPPHYIDGRQFPPSQTDYSSVPSKKENLVLQSNYNRVLHEGSLPPAGGSNPLMAHSDESQAMQSAPPDYAANHAVPPQSGVSLTPELIATLAALIPANTQSLASTNVQLPSSASLRPAPLPSPAAPDKVTSSQGWRHEQVAASGSFHNLREEQTSHPSEQLGHQYSNQGTILSQYTTYSNATNGTEHSAQLILGGSQVQDPALNMQQMPTRPTNSFAVASQGGQYTVPQANQPYQFDAAQNAQNYGMMHAPDASGVFRPPPPVQQNPANTLNTQVQSGNIFQPQMGVPSASDKVNMEFPNQVQQLQSAISASGQGTSESENDKNQRYQSTLQFAASLLLQIQQQQQQANAQVVHGSGNQQ